jgi:peptidoglycan-N-acetylglucosamine deacetylase
MISVVVPALNEELNIRSCLESLKKQDLVGGYEIIVVDNGSRDKTAQIAREMGVKVVDCPRKGVSYARQAGAEAAAGDIIVQADADTIYPSHWLRQIERRFSARPDIVAVAGTFIYKNPPWWAPVENFLRLFANWLSVVFLRRPTIISGANFAFRKQTFFAIGGYHPEAYSSDQYEIATRLSQAGKVSYASTSWGATSERSVNKSLGQILIAFVHNIALFLSNTFPFKYLKNPAAAKKRPTARTYTGIGLMVFLVLVIAFVACGYFIPASPVFGKVYSRGATHDKIIALTFDDGPNEPYTSEILDILAQYGIHATFFVVGKNAELYPEIARRIISDGNVIGNHTYSHNANHALTSQGQKDLLKAEQSIYAVTGFYPHLYRPPHGKKSPWELDAIKDAGLIEIVWDIEVNDLSGAPPEELARDIVSKAKPGGIILLHDGYGTSHNDANSAKRSVTVKELPIVIQLLQDKGYDFVTVPEMLNVPPYLQAAK